MKNIASVRNALLTTLADSLTKKELSSNIKGLGRPSNNAGRAFASMFLSIVNYGYNVANRREFIDEKNFPEKSGGLSVSSESYDECYIRSELVHPSRVIIDDLREIITSTLQSIQQWDKFYENYHKTHPKDLSSYGLSYAIAILKAEIESLNNNLEKLITERTALLSANNSRANNPSKNTLKKSEKKIENNLDPSPQQKELVDQKNETVSQLKTLNQTIQEHNTRITEAKNILLFVEAHPHHIAKERSYYNFALILALNTLDGGSIKAISSQMSNKHYRNQLKYSTWLGQLPTVEECVEAAFVQMPLSLIEEICYPILQKKIKEHDQKNTLCQTNHSASQNDSNHTLASSNYVPDIYSHLVQTRIDFVRKTVAEILKKKEISFPLVNIFVSQSDYPCLMFDCQELLKKINFAAEKKDDQQKKLVNFVLTFFCGLLNYYSIGKYGENFIWTETQSSFGSIRPSLTDTGDFFRLSPGLPPDNFSGVIQEAYIALIQCLDNEGINQLNNQLVKNTKKDILYNNNTHGTRGKMHMLALQQLSKNPSIQTAFAEYVTAAMETAKKTNLDKSKILEMALSGCCGGSSSQQVSHENAELLEEKGLRILLSQLIKSVSNISTSSSSSVFYSLEIQLKNLLQLFHDNTDKDYSKICFQVENIMRLLKIKEDLNRLIRYQNASSTNSSHPISSSSFLSLPFLSSPLATKSDFARIYTEDSVISQAAYPTRNGMSSLYLILKSLIPCLQHDTYESLINLADKHPSLDNQKKLLGHFAEESYFEITWDILKEIKEYQQQPDNSNKKTLSSPSSSSSANTTLAGLTFKIIDLAQFPTLGIYSKKSQWCGNWDNIHQDSKPDILIVDITSAKPEDVFSMIKKLHENQARCPVCIITFASDNKFAQAGVDLISMGEVRIYTKKNADPSNNLSYSSPHLHLFINSLSAALRQAPGNSISSKSERRVLEKARLRRSFEITLIRNMLDATLQLDWIEQQQAFFKKFIENYLEMDKQKLKSRIRFLEKLNKILEKKLLKQVDSDVSSIANSSAKDQSDSSSKRAADLHSSIRALQEIVFEIKKCSEEKSSVGDKNNFPRDSSLARALAIACTTPSPCVTTDTRTLSSPSLPMAARTLQQVNLTTMQPTDSKQDSSLTRVENYNLSISSSSRRLKPPAPLINKGVVGLLLNQGMFPAHSPSVTSPTKTKDDNDVSNNPPLFAMS